MGARADPLFDSYIWKKILAALTVNALAAPAIIAFLFLSNLVDETFPEVMAGFKNSYPSFFWPINKFPAFFERNVMAAPLLEELFSRGPIRISAGFIMLFRKDLGRKFSLFVWAAGLALNYRWAITHTAHEFFWIPVFTAGLVWLWLVIKTNRLWPAMFCHAAANLSVYFLVKIFGWSA